MGGKMPPEYWREYRKRNREKLLAQERARRKTKPRVRDRTAEYAKRIKARVDRTPLPLLHAQEFTRNRGRIIAFWEEELEHDMIQEAHLAKLEGRDPVKAMQRYETREKSWRNITCELIPEIN
jgi:enterochelin esterase-like enzyme